MFKTIFDFFFIGLHYLKFKNNCFNSSFLSAFKNFSIAKNFNFINSSICSSNYLKLNNGILSFVYSIAYKDLNINHICV